MHRGRPDGIHALCQCGERIRNKTDSYGVGLFCRNDKGGYGFPVAARAIVDGLGLRTESFPPAETEGLGGFLRGTPRERELALPLSRLLWLLSCWAKKVTPPAGTGTGSKRKLRCFISIPRVAWLLLCPQRRMAMTRDGRHGREGIGKFFLHIWKISGRILSVKNARIRVKEVYYDCKRKARAEKGRL